MNKFYMNGKLIHKASNHNTKRCEVEKWVFLPHSDFERLKANPYQEHEAITAARDLMYEDKNAYHCIMLLDEYGEDGLLIEAEGFDYPRLSMFVPDAKSIYERYQTSEPELKLHDMIKDTVEKIAELAHTGKTDFTSADMIDMDEVDSLVKNAIIQQLTQRDDISMAKNTDIGVDFQPDIHVEAEKLTELKFYCPLKVQREINPSFDEDEDEFFEDTEELSDFEVLEYESEISGAIEAYQSDEEENRGIMAYLGDRKRFADKVYSIFPSVEKVGDRLMGVFTCQICGELDSYEYDELLQELCGQASDGYCEGLEQHEMGWTVRKEFLEKGVSGFKVSATDRDAIQELKAAALRNEFQILLVFMFDRIGRIDDETPFVVEWFVKHGIRVWSVQEGEQRFESHVDKLMNYIRFWQASGESEKTSMRIKTRMQQLTAEGSYTGGGVPFGYQLEKRGRLNKRGKEIYDLVINPVEAEWVVEIFEKTVKYGYGSHRLATYLNENGVRTHSGAKFQCNTIIRILRNKLTCGYMVSGDTVSPHMKELQIIDEKMFERAQYILEQRAMKNSDERQIALSTKSQAMLSGVMFCAHCGGRMTSNMHTEKYTVKSTGEVKKKHYLRYICYHRSRKLCDCDGQSVYSAEKVDKAVIEVVASIFSKISDAPDEAELRKEYNKEMQKCRAKQTKLGTELKKYQKQYDKLNEEIANTLIGESFYSPEQLSTAMTTVQQRITAINQQLEKIGNEMEQKKASMEKVRPMYEMFKGWAEEFRMATIEQKKMIISQVISRIEIGKGYKINITLNMEYEQFCVGWNGLNNL